MNSDTPKPFRETIHAFFTEPIPKSIGWRSTLGSLAGTLLLLQILTGVLMAFYYVPHPEDASKSLHWMQENIPAGGLIRALHYWGASFVVVALFIHVIRVFFSGAYRRPRQAIWLMGVILLGLTLTLAFTGQLLPFNQAGYWAAKVGVQIAATAPIVGSIVKQVMLGGDTIGELTLTRFYALHVVLLPGMLGVFVILHLFFLRKHGPLRPPNDATDETEPFFPMQFARDMTVASVGIVGLIVVALFAGLPELAPIDLSSSTYVPRPEWYFLSHFELLRMTPSSLELLTTFVLPSAMALAMVALPWLDRPTAQGRRKVIMAAGALVFIGIVTLTAKGLLRGEHEHSGGAQSTEQGEEAKGETGGDRERLAAGRRVFMREKCLTCHKLNGRGGTKAIDLGATGDRLQENYLREWLRNPQAFRPDVEMPPVTVNNEDFENLVLFLQSLTAKPK